MTFVQDNPVTIRSPARGGKIVQTIRGNCPNAYPSLYWVGSIFESEILQSTIVVVVLAGF